MENSKPATQKLAKDYADRGDPDGWFEEFYARAGGDISKVYWADLKANLCWSIGSRNNQGLAQQAGARSRLVAGWAMMPRC
jgi:hypothetical protein